MVININRVIGAFLFLMVLMPGGDLQCADLSDGEKRKIVDQLYNTYRLDLPQVKDIQPAEVIHLFNQHKVVLIDIRTSAEIKISTLPRAVTMDDYLKGVDTYRGLIAVAYCTIGYRSGKFAEKMGAKGIEVKNLAGGMLAWVFDGGRIYNENNEIKRIHVYGPKWDYPPSGYESVMFS
ncbi:MAG: rhodanese-like domain-containing protein, partial [Deltaproteobacteria bacterium]|nr:rhodanese-like domain-containing protein [Deltaproteobacteria bacterium]